MMDLNNVPGLWYGKKHNEPWLRPSNGRVGDKADALWKQHHADLVAEADEYRLVRSLPRREGWQCRVCRSIGRWLIAAGARLEAHAAGGLSPQLSEGSL